MSLRLLVFFSILSMILGCKQSSQSSKVEVREGEKLSVSQFHGAAYYKNGDRICNFSLYQTDKGFFAATTAHCMVNFAIPNDGILRLSSNTGDINLTIESMPNAAQYDLMVFKVKASSAALFRPLEIDVNSLKSVDLVSYGPDRAISRRRLSSGFLASRTGLICNHDFKTIAGQSGGGLYGSCAPNTTDSTGCKLICIHRGNDDSGDEPIGVGAVPPSGP